MLHTKWPTINTILINFLLFFCTIKSAVMGLQKKLAVMDMAGCLCLFIKDLVIEKFNVSLVRGNTKIKNIKEKKPENTSFCPEKRFFNRNSPIDLRTIFHLSASGTPFAFHGEASLSCY